MWIAKGTLLALWLFGFGTMALLYFSIYRRLPPNSAVDVRIIAALTMRNPLWWAALVLCFVTAFAVWKLQHTLGIIGSNDRLEYALAQGRTGIDSLLLVWQTGVGLVLALALAGQQSAALDSDRKSGTVPTKSFS